MSAFHCCCVSVKRKEMNPLGFVFDLVIHFLISSLISLGSIFSFLFSLTYDHFFAQKVKIQYSRYAIVITGCDSGFGELSSRKLSSMGFHVISCCITADGVARLADTVSLAIVCDVTKETDVKELVLQTESYLQDKQIKLWAIVNNAGIGNSGAFDWIPTETIRKVMEVNFFGVVNVTKAFLPLLKQTKHSRIINLSSVAGFSSGPMMGAYAASKHAVEGLMKSVRMELKPWNIHVTNINPGFFRSPPLPPSRYCFPSTLPGRTPIVTKNTPETLKTFQSLPSELKSQYDQEIYTPSEFVLKLLEDPQLVVDAIVRGVTEKYVPMWLFPGIQSGYVLRSGTCSPFFPLTHGLADT
jgi:NAD(P)-dependent dehydrogenase (short-subunit alcohol dehydrogenase family)